MPEKNIVIDNQIVGILTYPQDYVEGMQMPAVLMLHGFGTNKNEINNIYVDIAERLAKNEIISFC